MKKLSIYLMMLLTAGLTSCNEDFNEGVASPQSYGQEEAASKIGFTATGVDPINLGQVETERLAVCTFTAPTVQNATFSYQMKLDNKASIMVDAQGTVVTEDLQNAVAQIYGIRPVERTMEAILTVYVTSGAATYAASAEKFELKVTPKAPVIEGAYYINGTLTWNENVAFGNSSGDPYESSIFTVIVPALIEDENKAKDAFFLIESTSGQKIGSTEAGSDALEGFLTPSTTPNPIKVAAGDYKSVKISIDMMEGTYKIEKLAEAPYLWVAGNHQEWAPKSAPTLYNPEGADAYWGMVALNGEFKFTGQPYWPGGTAVGAIDYGFGYFTKLEGEITESGGNLVLPQNLYYLVVDLGKADITATKIEYVGLIGGATGGWGDSDEVDMVYDAAQKCWTVTTDFTADQFKIRLNRGWTVGFAGTLDAPNPFAGGNMAMDKAGNYTVKFYLNGRIVFIKNN